MGNEDNTRAKEVENSQMIVIKISQIASALQLIDQRNKTVEHFQRYSIEPKSEYASMISHYDDLIRKTLNL